MITDQIIVSKHGNRLGLDAYGRLLVNPGIVNPSPAGICIFANAVPSSPVTNSIVETLFDQFATVKAGTLAPSSLLRVQFQGIATATNSTDTLAVKLYIGGLAGTALIASAAVDVANNDIFRGEFELIVRTVGATGTMLGVGTYRATGAAGTPTVKDAILASTAINTLVDQVIGVSATWSVANAGNSCRLDFLRVIQH